MCEKKGENKIPKKYVSQDKKVLDVGGWASPCKKATHVVDLFPWETRNYGIYTSELPGERFSRDTWHQVNFLEKEMRLPYEENEFDFSVCSHTLEDLINPEPIISEIIRVSKRGRIIVPNRIHEQTVGVRDGKSNEIGHPHHYWIVDKSCSGLIFYNKHDTEKGGIYNIMIPYNKYKIKKRTDIINFKWEESFDLSFVVGHRARKKAINFANEVEFRSMNVMYDYARRLAKKMVDRVVGRGALMENWDEIVERSRPYSSIPLPND
jgi:hypothetical protein